MNGDEAAKAQAEYAPNPSNSTGLEMPARDCCEGLPVGVDSVDAGFVPKWARGLSESQFREFAKYDVPEAGQRVVDAPDAGDYVQPLPIADGQRFSEQSILYEADQITSCDRNKTYGPPRDNHSRTAALWSAYLSGLNGRSLDYRDVCWLNVLQKASRDVFHRQRDSLVDAAGYLRNVEMADNDEGRA